MQAIFETLFDVVYLCTVIFLGIRMIRQSGGRRQYLLFGIMAVTLGAGDAFHLVPRALALCTDGLANHVTALGIGKLITSVTMTVFYVLLFHVWKERYRPQKAAGLTAAAYALAGVRVILCLLPQNGWTDTQPSLLFGILRNVPFALLGLMVVALFYRSAAARGDQPFRWLWLTVVISFACYLPVVLFSSSAPLVGMLMIPKTCAYVWTVVIGYRAMKGEGIHEKVS